MSQNKKIMRQLFRDVCFKRDHYCCRCCKKPGKCRQTGESKQKKPVCLLDCHHIVPRTNFEGGGYVEDNGITLCDECHIKAENFYQFGETEKGFYPEDLYALIGSSFEKAMEADLKAIL